MAATSNKLTPSQVAQASATFGAKLADGENSRCDLAKHLFDCEVQGCFKDNKDAAREQYVHFAQAALKADKRGAVRIDLANTKSVTTQVSKLNAFIVLAQRNAKARSKLFDKVPAIVRAMPADGKPTLSTYECLVKVAIAQAKEGDRNLSDDEIRGMLPVKSAAETKTRIQHLDAIIKAMDTYAKMYAGTGGEKDVSTARDALKAVRPGLLASVESKEVETDETLTQDGAIVEAPNAKPTLATLATGTATAQ